MMQNNKRCNSKHFCKGNRSRHGPSSFDMQDHNTVFNELKLVKGQSFLDIGCGSGDYSLHASKIIGDSGRVYAIDKWEELINNLTQRAISNGLKNIKGKVADISVDKLPFEDSSIDVCFIATVLHTIDISKYGKNIFSEISRVLKPNGRLAIIECKKDNNFGPPKHLRLSPEEIGSVVLQYGFNRLNLTDLGYNFLIQFKK